MEDDVYTAWLEDDETWRNRRNINRSLVTAPSREAISTCDMFCKFYFARNRWCAPTLVSRLRITLKVVGKYVGKQQ